MRLDQGRSGSVLERIIVNLKRGGFIGAVQGKSGSINAYDFTDSGVTANFSDCSFENIGTYAIHAGNVFNLGLRNCHLEEVGNGDGMVDLNTVRVVEIDNLMVNLAGRSVPGPAGNVIPFPTQILKTASVQSISISGLYLHNTYNPKLQVMTSSAPSYRFAGILWDAHAPSPGPGVTIHRGALHVKGQGTPRCYSGRSEFGQTRQRHFDKKLPLQLPIVMEHSCKGVQLKMHWHFGRTIVHLYPSTMAAAISL